VADVIVFEAVGGTAGAMPRYVLPWNLLPRNLLARKLLPSELLARPGWQVRQARRTCLQRQRSLRQSESLLIFFCCFTRMEMA